MSQPNVDEENDDNSRKVRRRKTPWGVIIFFALAVIVLVGIGLPYFTGPSKQETERDAASRGLTVLSSTNGLFGGWLTEISFGAAEKCVGTFAYEARFAGNRLAVLSTHLSNGGDFEMQDPTRDKLRAHPATAYCFEK